MKYLMILLCLEISLKAICQEDTQKKHFVLNRIVKCFNQIRIFEDSSQNNFSSHFDDSIDEYNSKLLSYINSTEFSNLSNSELQEISHATEIKISYSRDSGLKVVSWCAFSFAPSPTCSNVAVFKRGKTPTTSVNNNSEVDFGINIQVDTIIKEKYKDKPYYILIGSNKCGNLCIQEIASIYSISGGKLVKHFHAFYDGNYFLNDLKFDYILNDQIAKEPYFMIVNGAIICPVFNERKTKVISRKRYNIKL
jgi:hypothetical protein